MQESAQGIVSVPSLTIFDNIPNIPHFFSSHFAGFVHFFQESLGVFITISIPLCLLMFIVIVIVSEKLRALRKKEHELYNSHTDMGYDEVSKGDTGLAQRWAKVMEYVESKNENDWRHAIIEADIMLGDLLVKMGYKGESIGEQLKRVVVGDFKTLDQAWEAHKVRNIVAHGGSEFQLSQHEARRVISLYREVFEEFFYI